MTEDSCSSLKTSKKFWCTLSVKKLNRKYQKVTEYFLYEQYFWELLSEVLKYDYFIHVVEPDLPRKHKDRRSGCERILSPCIMDPKELYKSRKRVAKGLPDFDKLKEKPNREKLEKELKTKFPKSGAIKTEEKRIARKMFQLGAKVGLLESVFLLGKKWEKMESKHYNLEKG